MQGGNEVDYPGVISTSCQRRRCAVLGRPAGRRGEDHKMILFSNNVYKFHILHGVSPQAVTDSGNIVGCGVAGREKKKGRQSFGFPPCYTNLGAEGESRTPTSIRPLDPEPSASTSSATSARSVSEYDSQTVICQVFLRMAIKKLAGPDDARTVCEFCPAVVHIPLCP